MSDQKERPPTGVVPVGSACRLNELEYTGGVISRPISNFKASLLAISEIAASLAHQADAWETTEASLALSPMKASSGGTRSSGVPDPTHHVVVSFERWHEIQSRTSEGLAIMRALQSRYARVRHEQPDEARRAEYLSKSARCSGEIDPTCARNAVRVGLCWPCYQKERRRSRSDQQTLPSEA